MKKIFVNTILVFVFVYTNGQHGNTGFSVIQYKPISFNYSRIDQLLSPQEIPDAFEIRLNSSPKALSVYVQIINRVAGNSGIFENQLSLILKHNTNTSITYTGRETFFTQRPTLLFTQQAQPTGSTKTHQYFYNLRMKEFQTFMKIGSHNFEMIFTLTEE